MRIKPYIFYLQDTSSGNCFYVDTAGNIQSQSIMAAGTTQDVSLQHAPDGWMEATLGYSRNKKYYGFSRSYSDPLKLVYDAAYIARTKFYLGQGVESKLSLLILKYNANPVAGDPTYRLYHKAPLDLPQKNDEVSECFTVNLLEGGILQMLKTYENTVFSIPCDGSIPENTKVNMDGMYFQDTFNYQIIPCAINTQTNNFANVMPASFISNDGDNIGVIHADPQLANIAGYSGTRAYFSTSPNFIFSAVRPTTVRVRGLINVQPANANASLSLNYYTSLSDNSLVNPLINTHAGSLLTNTTDDYQVKIPGQQTFYFDRSISLAANENLFLSVAAREGTNNTLAILGGSFSMQFSSIAADTAPWCITAYDLFKLIIKNINQVSSNAFQTVNFGADSTLLQSKLNFFVTSGDAIRASGDPNYQKFYNAVQTNPLFPNINNTYSFGPVIKTSLADFFASFNAILNASMGNQTLAGEGETVFFERKDYVFNSSVDTFDLGEVADFSISIDLDKIFTILKIGYPDQTYDQKAGKYEWNTSLQMVSPINSIASKTFEITSKYRADAYGIERLRANIDTTSSQRNSSDNSVFIINTDQSSFIYDFFDMGFTSAIQDPTLSTNTNIKLITGRLNQGISLTVLRSGYFSVNNDPSILVLSQPGLSSSKTLAINITGSFNGSPFNALTLAPADTLVLKLYVNGVVVKTYTTTAIGAAVPINITDSLTRVWNVNDNIYVQANTSSSGTAQISLIDLNMAAGYFDASGASITIEAGSTNKMIALPTISAPFISSLPVLTYGFQYLQFNSALANKNFTTAFNYTGAFSGFASPAVEVDLYVNGNLQAGLTANASGGWQSFAGNPSFTRDWALGDVMFVLGSTFGTVSVQLQALDLKVTSTQIKAFALKRVQYDYISGIPALCGYVISGGVTTAIPVTTGPGAPYNIEDLTPKQMLLNWGNYLRSIFWDQQDQQLKFSTLTKNQYLVTKLGTNSLVQNADVQIGSLDPALFSLNKASFKTRVPLTFDQVMRQSVNAFLSWTYNGQLFYGFAEDMKQKATLNEVQQWEALIA